MGGSVENLLALRVAIEMGEAGRRQAVANAGGKFKRDCYRPTFHDKTKDLHLTTPPTA